MARVLHEFQASTKAIASEVNENFAAVQEDINDMGSALDTYFKAELTKTKEDILTDFEEAKNTKLNVDMTNSSFPYIKECFQGETGWYVIYSNNKLVQGGTITSAGGNGNKNGNANITFLIEFADENYEIQATCKACSDYLRMGVWNYITKSKGSITGNTRHVNEGGSASYKLAVDWVAYGMVAGEE